MKELLRRLQHAPIQEQVRAINQVLRGHFNYYGLAGNAGKLQAFFNFTQREWKHLLSRRSQRGRCTWEQLLGILHDYPLVTPRIRITYSQLATYVRL